MKNSVDPDQMASEEAIWSGSSLFFRGNAYPGTAGQGLKIISFFISYKKCPSDTRPPFGMSKSGLFKKIFGQSKSGLDKEIILYYLSLR